MLTIPLRVHGTDPTDKPFKVDARTTSINRHGARIQISHPLFSDQVVRLVNVITNRETDFRVVGPTSPPTDKAAEWGLQCVNPKEDIWGIHFPPRVEGEDPDSVGLVECHKCHTVTLMRLSVVEAEVLETSGILQKRCDTCETVTSWRYTEKQVAMGPVPDAAAAAATAESQTPAEPAPTGADRRQYRRVSMRLPVRIRDYYGGAEITKSEDVSKGGLSFVNNKSYHLGQGIMVSCPYNPSTENIEVHAQIVRRREMAEINSKVYGVKYNKPNV
jgi:hypothetical protein